jgi:hypothetical protein
MKNISKSALAVACLAGIGIGPVQAGDNADFAVRSAQIAVQTVDLYSYILSADSLDFAVVYRCTGPKPILARVSDCCLPGDVWRVTVNKTIGLGVDTESNQVPTWPGGAFLPDVFSPYAQNADDGATLVTVTAANAIPGSVPAGLTLEIQGPLGKSLNCDLMSIEGGTVVGP